MLIHQLGAALRRRLRSHPLLYFAVARWRRRPFDGSRRVLTADTQIVIDGYPRSANTYATHGFRLGQPGPLVIGHHFHAAGAVRRSVARGLPTVVLIRRPAEAIASLMQFRERSDAVELNRDYIAYYEPLLPVLSRVVVAPFPWVIADLEGVVRAVNARWGTTFSPPVMDEDVVMSELRRIEERVRGGGTGRQGGHTHPAHRSLHRFPAEMPDGREDARCAALSARADRVYRLVLEHAPREHAWRWSQAGAGSPC